jgi:acyl-CoA hydrolase
MRYLALSFVVTVAVSIGVAGPSDRVERGSFVVFPADTNAMGTLFGGKAFSEMDRAAAIAVRRELMKSPKGVDTAVTKTATIEYLKPAKVRDLMSIETEIRKVGTTSISVRVWLGKQVAVDQYETCAVADFVFISLGSDGKPVAHGLPEKAP